MEATLIEITIYKETTVEWVKPRIKSMICNIRKQKTTMQTTRRKRIQKNEDTISSLWDNFKRPNIHIKGVPEKKRKNKKKLKELIITKLLYEMLKGLILEEEEEDQNYE